MVPPPSLVKIPQQLGPPEMIKYLKKGHGLGTILWIGRDQEEQGEDYPEPNDHRKQGGGEGRPRKMC
jgi:hypothetical protein